VLNVDRGMGELIAHPSSFDTVVTLNYVGDVICDALVAFVYGSRGMGFSGNFNNNGFASYQTVHGAALDLTNQNTANPIGQILSAAMLLEYSLGADQEAAAIKKAIKSVLDQRYRTFDIHENGCTQVSTREMGTLIAQAVTTA